MKHSSYTIIFSVLLPFISQAQLKGLVKKVQNKVEQKVEQRIDKKIDQEVEKTLDEIEGKGTDKKENGANKNSSNTGGIKSYSKYDFVPGEKIIYSNDFSADNAGELPIGWNTNGNGVVASFSFLSGKWVQFYQNATYLTDNVDSFTQNFTVEFDLLLRRDNPKAAFPMMAFGVLSSGDLTTTDNKLLKEYSNYFAVELKVQPYDNMASHMHLETFQEKKRYLNTDIKKFGELENHFNKPIHVAMQVQKERLRIWFNEEKLYDLPKAIDANAIINQLYFSVKRYGGSDSEVGYAVSNIKIAKGLPDTRHKLVEEGKFSTTGILFEVNSATIKPESNGVLKEVADVLKKFNDIKVLIVGHTDADGSDAANLELSKKRAEAVQQVLISEFGIDATRISADGKGEKEPVGDNKTKEGKAQNRRVEFIKQ
jgi:outer membrane protein OmpA-like peptidoglycan-associated protein